MNRSQLAESFAFRQFHYHLRHHNDASRGNDCHYVGFLRKGSATIKGEDVTLQVREGELFYIPMGYRYHSYWEGAEEVILDSYGFTYFPRPSAAAYPLQIIPLSSEIRERLQALAEHRSVDCRSIGMLYLLLDAILPHMETESFGNKGLAVQKAMEFMHSQSKLNVPEMARFCRVSESGLYAAFRAVKGCTPIEMWHRIQAEKAVNLLLSTNLSVEEVASHLGFCSASYFRKILREVTGQTPRQIRRGV